jgi:dTDP-4-dehydrorhamnose reductase
MVKKKRETSIIPITSEEFPTATLRQKYSFLDCQKVYSVFWIKQPDLPAVLRHFISEQENYSARGFPAYKLFFQE